MLGKFLGLNLVVGLQASIFALGTWAAIGVATGVWSPAYLLSVPLLMLQFAFFYSFSLFLAANDRGNIYSSKMRPSAISVNGDYGVFADLPASLDAALADKTWRSFITKK